MAEPAMSWQNLKPGEVLQICETGVTKHLDDKMLQGQTLPQEPKHGTYQWPA